MSESDTTDEEPATNDEPESEGGRDVRTYLLRGALLLLTLLAVLATLRFYLAASTAIDVWIDRRYRPLFQAAFNLVVLLAAGIGISVVVRRLSGYSG